MQCTVLTFTDAADLETKMNTFLSGAQTIIKADLIDSGTDKMYCIIYLPHAAE